VERRPGPWCRARRCNRSTVGHPPQDAREERKTTAAGWETERDAGEGCEEENGVCLGGTGGGGGEEIAARAWRPAAGGGGEGLGRGRVSPSHHDEEDERWDLKEYLGLGLGLGNAAAASSNAYLLRISGRSGGLYRGVYLWPSLDFGGGTSFGRAIHSGPFFWITAQAVLSMVGCFAVPPHQSLRVGLPGAVLFLPASLRRFN
jgi:hypothetical protein